MDSIKHSWGLTERYSEAQLNAEMHKRAIRKYDLSTAIAVYMLSGICSKLDQSSAPAAALKACSSNVCKQKCVQAEVCASGVFVVACAVLPVCFKQTPASCRSERKHPTTKPDTLFMSMCYQCCSCTAAVHYSAVMYSGQRPTAVQAGCRDALHFQRPVSPATTATPQNPAYQQQW